MLNLVIRIKKGVIMPTVKKVIDEKGFYGDAIISDKVKAAAMILTL
jgi:hypothetical protein